jgi:hypothetical protein
MADDTITITSGQDDPPMKTPGEETIEAVLDRCLRDGLEPPFAVAVMNAQGLGAMGRYRRENEAWQAEELSASSESAKLSSGDTLHLMVVDCHDQGRLVKVKVKLKPRQWLKAKAPK